VSVERSSGDPDETESAGEVVTLADGGRILVRTLRPSDRDQLARRYLDLSPEARRLRFFSAPDHLSEHLLDHLMDVDGRDRMALVATAIDDDGAPGVGISRYVRDTADPSRAEAAVTVIDAYQGRGIATALLQRLVSAARDNGIRTFTANVMWENHDLLDGLRAHGARITPDEPGVASVLMTVPEPDDEVPTTELHRALSVFASRIGERIGLRFTR